MAAEGNVVRFTYTGADNEVIDDEATHVIVHKDCTVVRARAFLRHPNIVELICHDDVEMIEQEAFYECPSLRRVIMPGVLIVEMSAFCKCRALEYVECDKLEIIGGMAFFDCKSLRSINLPSARIVSWDAFAYCDALTDVKFGSRLEEMAKAFRNCKSLERITIPLKHGLITSDCVFQGCDNLRHVDLIKGELHETISAFHFVEWRNDVNDEIGLINQILLNAPAGWWYWSVGGVLNSDPGEKAEAVQMWIISVLLKIVYYQVEHRHLLDDAAMTLQLALPNEIVMNNVLPFLELPSYNFDVWYDHHARRRNIELLEALELPLPIDDSDEEEEQASRADSSLGDDEEE